MTRYHHGHHHHKPRIPFWEGVKRFGFLNALKYEFRHPRRYPWYPFWFTPMIVPILILAVILFLYANDYLSYLFYLLEIIVVGYMMYRLIKRLDRIHIRGSLLRLWGLRLLSVLVSAIGLVMLYFILIMFFLAPLETLLNQESAITQFVMFGNQWNTPFVIPLIFEVIGIGLLLIGAYLLFKFKMHSGNVIWIGRF